MVRSSFSRYRSIGVLAVAAAAALTSAAEAATVTSTLSSSATVSATCTVSTTAVAFGTFNSIAGINDDANGTVSVTCTNGVPWTATAGVGAGVGASYTSRKLTSGANLLNYNLYSESTRTTIWGDGVTGGSGTITGTGNGAVQANTIYGRIPLGQSAAVIGSYTDSVAVTITY